LKRFRFTLEKLLSIRSHREQEAKIELGRAMGVLADIENKLKAIATVRVQAASDRFSAANSAADILSYELYIKRLDADIERLLKEAAQAELLVNKARDAFIEASRDRKVLDKVKEKRQQEYRKLRLAEETKVLDDISGGAAARLLVGGGV
jgi:flagellar FliJ protein